MDYNGNTLHKMRASVQESIKSGEMLAARLTQRKLVRTLHEMVAAGDAKLGTAGARGIVTYISGQRVS